MAKNFIQQGDTIPVTVGADIASGDIVQSGYFIGVALANALSGAVCQVGICGVYSVPCLSTDVVSQGDALYFDAAEEQVKLDDEAGANDLAGYAWAAKGNGVTTVELRLLN